MNIHRHFSKRLKEEYGDGLLSLDFGLAEFGYDSPAERFLYYRKFLYEKGSLSPGKGARIDSGVLSIEKKRGFALGTMDRFRYRTRYFTDSGVIGTKAFVARCYQMFKDSFSCRREKRPLRIAGLHGIFSLKSLSEAT